MDNLPPNSQDSAFWHRIHTNGLVRFLLFFALWMGINYDF